jgi:hypothetical protein
MNEKVDLVNLKKQLEILGVEAIGYITKILAENDKQVTGNLIKSLDFKVVKDVDGFFLQILAAPYFKNVDEGRRPGKMPPVKPIQKWADRRGIKFKNMSQQQTAFVIARSIGKKGIKPLNITNKLINDVIIKKEKLIKSGAAKDIQDFIEKTFIKPLKSQS